MNSEIEHIEMMAPLIKFKTGKIPRQILYKPSPPVPEFLDFASREEPCITVSRTKPLTTDSFLRKAVMKPTCSHMATFVNTIRL